MNITRMGSIAAVALAGALALASCSAEPGGTPDETTAPPETDYSSLSGTITAGGSSAQGNAQAAWTTAFNGLAGGVTINYDKSQGSGGGVTNFLAGSYDFAGSDSPLKEDQTAEAASGVCGADGAIDIPVYLDGVAIIFNVPGVTELNLTSATIAKIFNLQITDWSDPAITADNGGTALPAGAITTVARSDGSGTTQNFANFLVGTASADWPYEASNAWPVEGNVSKQQGGSGVVSAVEAGTGTIGYADHSAIGDLAFASVNGVEFSAEAAGAALTEGGVSASNGVDGDLSYTFDYSKFADSTTAYPIPLMSYAILCKTFSDETQGELTKAYLGFVTSSTGQEVAAKNAGSAPLPQEILDLIADSLADVK